MFDCDQSVTDLSCISNAACIALLVNTGAAQEISGNSRMLRFLLGSDNLTTSWKHNCSCHKRAQCIYLQCRQSYSVYLAETILLPQKQSPAHSVSLLYRTTRLLLVLKQSTAAPDGHVIRSQPIQIKREQRITRVHYDFAPCIVCLNYTVRCSAPCCTVLI